MIDRFVKAPYEKQPAKLSLDNIPIETYSKIHESMPIVCVDCIISIENKILLVKRKVKPARNQWWFPGGRLLRDEKLSDASQRIVKREIGIDIDKPTYLAHGETKFVTDPFDHGRGTHTINFLYFAIISSVKNITLDNDHSEYSIVSCNEIYKSDMHSYVKDFTGLAMSKILKRI